MLNKRVQNLIWENIQCSVTLHIGSTSQMPLCIFQLCSTHPEQLPVICGKFNYGLDGKSQISQNLTVLFTSKRFLHSSNLPHHQDDCNPPAAEEVRLLVRSKFLRYSSSSHYLLCLLVCVFCLEPSVQISHFSRGSRCLSFLPKQLLLCFTFIFPAVPSCFCGKTYLIYFSLLLDHSQFCSIILPLTFS